MKRYISIFKRLFRGLRLVTMILVMVLTYIAWLKKGRPTKSLFTMLLLSASISAGLCSLGTAVDAKAKPVTKSVAKNAGPPKQIFERSKSVSGSEIMNFQGKPAYIVSAMGTNSGVLITDVSSGIATSCGIDIGDVLLSINQHVVTTPRDADRILSDTKSGQIRVAFAHQGDTGLQLYNAQYNYVQKAGSGLGATSIASSPGKSKMSYEDLQKQIPDAESHMVTVINRDRAQNGLSPVQQDSALCLLARAHSEDMGKRKYFNHVDPDGMNPADRAKAAGLPTVAENISFRTGFASLNQAGEASEAEMMAEPPNQQNHRGNILGPKHQSVGVGIAVMKDGKFFMTQEFSDR